MRKRSYTLSSTLRITAAEKENWLEDPQIENRQWKRRRRLEGGGFVGGE